MLLIRLAYLSDTEALAHLFLQARRAAFPWVDPVLFQLSDFASQTQGETIWVAALAEGPVVGFISVWPPSCFVHHLFVAPAYQGQDIGQRLLASLTSWLPLPYTLKCLTRNTRALTFYLKNGWLQAGSSGQGNDAYQLLQFGTAPPACPNKLSSSTEVGL
ncbi:GNAT family N-acetyltransferase [Hymenobacter volaticus]|uniref:GNAT family N-acetyltransferase n=1 Tax=Hymenobacter volaticus TaxID=2932254 RepID=A0ABY4GF95_9BACT|nr:GNAT family N-acetyltransferase [Hymenobacter volaticus]UOQ69600.1 GNAT family N-acetyltransferase [Hymenobacter volaticus]